MKLLKNVKEWNLKMLVYADDTVLVIESKSDLRMMIK